jgi:hypothetical protein
MCENGIGIATKEDSGVVRLTAGGWGTVCSRLSLRVRASSMTAPGVRLGAGWHSEAMATGRASSQEAVGWLPANVMIQTIMFYTCWRVWRAFASASIGTRNASPDNGGAKSLHFTSLTTTWAWFGQVLDSFVHCSYRHE